MRGLVAAMLLGLLPVADAVARDRTGEYKVRGLGGDFCISYLETTPGDRELYFSWLAGYLTSYNYLVRETYSIAEHSGIARTAHWFDDWCRSHPDARFHEAARAFVTERYRTRQKQGSVPPADRASMKGSDKIPTGTSR